MTAEKFMDLGWLVTLEMWNIGVPQDCIILCG